MIDDIIINIKSALVKQGYSDKRMLQAIDQELSFELAKYDFREKVTSLIIRDNSDLEIIQRYFIAKATAGLSKKSLVLYKTVLDRAFSKIGKHLKDITSDDIRAYLTSQKMGGACNITIDNERRVLNTFFNWTVIEEYIPKNPVIKIEKIRTEKVIKKPFTEEELEKLRITAKYDRDKAIIEFLYSTGCRVSEMVQLNRHDINWDEREVTVIGKGNKERRVFLSSRCIIILKKYLDSRKDSHPALFVTHYDHWRGDYYKNKVARLKISGVEIMVRTVGEKAGIPKAHPHRIRRTAATFALRRGMPIEQVSKMLGHEDLKTTTIYANSTMDDVKMAHDKYLI